MKTPVSISTNANVNKSIQSHHTSYAQHFLKKLTKNLKFINCNHDAVLYNDPGVFKVLGV